MKIAEMKAIGYFLCITAHDLEYFVPVSQIFLMPYLP